MGCSLPGSSVRGILQARILEWVAIPFSWGSSQPRDQTQVSCIAGRFFTVWATREAQGGKKEVQDIFCQTCKEDLMPILLKFFQNTKEEEVLPNLFYKVNITPLSKPDNTEKEN